MHGRPKGSSDYYLPLPVLSSYLILSWASDPKRTMSYKTEGENFHPSVGRKGFLGGDWALGGWGPGAKRGVLGRLAATLQPSVVYDSQKLWVLWLRVVLGLFFGPLGKVHGGVLGPLGTGSLHHAVSFPLRGFVTIFEPSISKILGFTR